MSIFLNFASLSSKCSYSSPYGPRIWRLTSLPKSVSLIIACFCSSFYDCILLRLIFCLMCHAPMHSQGTRKQMARAIAVMTKLKLLDSSCLLSNSRPCSRLFVSLTIYSSSKIKISSSIDSKSALMASHSWMKSSSVG